MYPDTTDTNSPAHMTVQTISFIYPLHCNLKPIGCPVAAMMPTRLLLRNSSDFLHLDFAGRDTTERASRDMAGQFVLISRQQLWLRG
jgi:hypothetical protein